MKFLAGQAAAQLGNTLLIADLHLAMEFELRQKGVQLGLQHRKLVSVLNGLLKETGARELLILGDAKHDVYGMWERERRLFLEFLTRLECEQLTVVKGNHDSHLQTLPEEFQGKKFKLEPVEGVMREHGGKKYGLFHGHAWPSREILEKADVFLLGHPHPLVEFRDKLGGVHRERAWVVGRTLANEKFGVRKGQQFVIFPAFNPLVGGQAINAGEARWGEESRGPLLHNNLLDIERAEVRLLSGASLGNVGSLRKFATDRSRGRAATLESQGHASVSERRRARGTRSTPSKRRHPPAL